MPVFSGPERLTRSGGANWDVRLRRNCLPWLSARASRRFAPGEEVEDLRSAIVASINFYRSFVQPSRPIGTRIEKVQDPRRHRSRLPLPRPC